ncbi:MAG: tail adaptor [Podoviridae sp. cty5g4]|nr:MAG: tail adaptor [Podoviridae sp. cty5g4]
MLVSDLIRASLRKIGAISLGETVSVDKNTEALQALQAMLRAWSQKRILVYATTKESFTLIPNQNSYTWGLGADINTTRPHKVLAAFIRDANGLDCSVSIISDGTYMDIASKSATSRPHYLNYNPTYPYSTIYLYPSPAIAEVLWLTSLKPFTETSSFADIGDTISFPPNYEEAIIYNLAMRLCSESQISPPAEVREIAGTSYGELIILNASLAVEPATVLLPAGGKHSRVYNINLG